MPVGGTDLRATPLRAPRLVGTAQGTGEGLDRHTVRIGAGEIARPERRRYDIGDPGELEFLGLDGAECVLWLVEWPERGGRSLPSPDLRISLRQEGDGRLAELQALTPIGDAWLGRVRTS